MVRMEVVEDGDGVLAVKLLIGWSLLSIWTISALKGMHGQRTSGKGDLLT